MSIEDERRKTIKALCRELVADGGNTRYMWLDDGEYQYEVELVICRLRNKRMNSDYRYCSPTGQYVPDTELIH